MGRLAGYRQCSLYVDPLLYERVKQTAYTLEEAMYEFFGEALASACERRTTQQQRDAIEVAVKHKLKNKAIHEKRR